MPNNEGITVVQRHYVERRDDEQEETWRPCQDGVAETFGEVGCRCVEKAGVIL